MPTYGSQREVWRLAQSPGDDSSGEFFVIRVTQEAFRSYEEYVARSNLYRKRQWACSFTKKGGLTYEQALASEARVAGNLGKVAPAHQEAVARQVHLSPLGLDALANQAWDAHKLPPKSLGKENERDDQKTQHPLINKPTIRCFISTVADLHPAGVWLLKESWAQHLGMDRSLPHELQRAADDTLASASPSKGGRAKREGAAGGAQDAGAMRTLEEEEARLRPGSVKWVAFSIMKAAGAVGQSVEQLLQQSLVQGLKTDWKDEKSAKRAFASVVQDSTFCRVGKGRYTLRAFPGVVPLVPDQQQARAEDDQQEEAPSAAVGQQVPGAVAAAEVAAAAKAAEAAPVPKTEAEVLAHCEANVKLAKLGAARREQSHTQAEQELQQLEEQLAMAEAAHKEQQRKARRLSNTSSGAGPRASPSKAPPSPAVPNGPDWQLPPHLQEFSGNAQDRRALIAWRKEQAQAELALKQKREKWLQEQKQSHANAARQANTVLTGLEKAVERARTRCQGTAAQLAQARKVVADAQRALEREQQRALVRAAKEKDRIAREAAKQAEREERERRRQEALTARRYPIDDGELADELAAAAAAEGVPPPPPDLPIGGVTWLSRGASRRLGDGLYVADLLSTFAPQLGVAAMSHAELETVLAALEGGAGDGAAAAAGAALERLVGTYQALLAANLADNEEEGSAGRLEQRWIAGAADAAAWPEVLRRYMHARAEATAGCEAGVASLLTASGGDGTAAGAAGVVDGEAAHAVAALVAGGPAALSGSQHLALLCFLLDEALDTALLRDTLAARIEAAGDKAAELRADMADDRRKLKDMAEGEREARKRKRSEALAKAQQAAAANAADAANGDADAAAASAPTKKAKAAKAEYEEPRFELPADLQEYMGDPSDRKAMLAWRQHAQAARKQLEKDKAQWLSQKQKRDKEREAADREALEEERRNAKARAMLESAIATKQSALERELARHAVRRTPLGADRHHRAYWWGLAGHKSGVLVQATAELARAVVAPGAAPPAADAPGSEAWGMLSDAGALAELVKALDVRGVREKDLKSAFDKDLPAISQVLQKAESGAQPAIVRPPKQERIRGLPPERALPPRHARQVAEQEIKASSKSAAAAAAAPPPPPPREAPAPAARAAVNTVAGPFHGWEAAAVHASIAHLNALAGAAAAARVDAPPGGWTVWRRKLQELADGQVDVAWAAEVGAAPGAQPGAAAAAAKRGGGAKGGRPQSGKARGKGVSDDAVQLGEGSDACAALLAVLRARLLQLEGCVYSATGEARFIERTEAADVLDEGGAEEPGSDAPHEPSADPEGVAEAPAQPAAAPTCGRKRPQSVSRRRGAAKRAKASSDEPVAGLEAGGEGADGGVRSEREGSEGADEGAAPAKQRLARGGHLTSVLQGDPEEVACEDYDSWVPERRMKACVWRAAEERASWQACAAAAVSAARTAYAAAMLAHHAAGPLSCLAKKPKKK